MPANAVNPQKQKAGIIGGLQTFLRHGPEHMRTIGRLGGRPKSPTLEDLIRRTASSELKKEVVLPNGLSALRRLYAERRGLL